MTKAPRRLRIFLDANVLFAAMWNSYGLPCRLLRRSDVFDILTCDMAVEEARRNLAAKQPEALAEFIALAATLNVFQTVVQGGPIPLNDKDKPIFYSAKASRSDVLLTGDKGFREVAAVEGGRGLLVLSPREFYKRFIASSVPAIDVDSAIAAAVDEDDRRTRPPKINSE